MTEYPYTNPKIQRTMDFTERFILIMDTASNYHATPIVNQRIDNVEDGCAYCFSEPWEGFNEAGIDKAIKILENISNRK